MSTTEPRRQHALPEKVQIRCLRNGILRVGGQVGFDTRTVVRLARSSVGGVGDGAPGGLWSGWWRISANSRFACSAETMKQTLR